MVERHPRSAFELVTKMPLRDFKDTADLETIFNEQRINCGVDYFDYCLLHNMGTNVYENAANTERLILLLPNLKTAALTRKENKR